VEPSPTSSRTRAELLAPTPGIEVRTGERGWASRILFHLEPHIVAFGENLFQAVRELGQHDLGGVGAGHHDGLFTQRGESVCHQSGTQAGCLLGRDRGEPACAGGADPGRPATARQDLQYGGMGDSGAEDPLEG
jgi:hypothetical protein